MKKYFPVAITVLFLLLVSCSLLYAGNLAAWNIKWNYDSSLDETVAIQGYKVTIDAKGWDTLHSDQKTILTRHVTDWNEYSKLPDQLPLEVRQHNFWLIKLSNITMVNKLNTGSLLEQLKDSGANFDIKIEVPGIVVNSNADKEGYFSAAWNYDSGKVMKLTTLEFNWLALLLVLFLLSALIVFLIFLRRIKSMEQFIAYEYSLEKAVEELGDPEGSKPGKK
ncbi:MAG: hypothetical protein ACOX6E_07950 [Syntrophomonadaceae bacterium]